VCRSVKNEKASDSVKKDKQRSWNREVKPVIQNLKAHFIDNCQLLAPLKCNTHKTNI